MEAPTPDGSSPRRPTNITLPETLITQARDLKINISQACEAGLAAQVKAAREANWLKDNRAAMDYWNNLVETEGLLLADLRVFNPDAF